MKPHYKNYKGSFELIDTKYQTTGLFDYDPENNVLNLTELPIKKWTNDYKQFLEFEITREDKK